MKNKYFVLTLLAILSKSAASQSISQLTITPANPSPADTIYVISTLTYSGNCSYGLVYTNTAVAGGTVTIMPTYCGHGASTTCVSTDTFKIKPLAVGNYMIKIEYHQGSVCPISSFDAVIGQTNTAISVNNAVATQIITLSDPGINIRIYPNPAKENVTIEMPGMVAGNAGLIIVRNILGEAVTCKKTESQAMMLDLDGLPPGIYTVELEGSSRLVSKQRLVVQ